jgi:hypothetical protein
MRAQSKIVIAEKDMKVINKIVKFIENSGCAVVNRDFAVKPTHTKQEE